MLATLSPSGIFDVILWPAGLAVLGVAIWAIGLRMEHDDGPAWIKWIGILPIVIGLFLGWPWFSQYIDSSAIGEMYRAEVPGNRMLMAHWGALFMPLIALVVVGIWYASDRRNR